PQRVAEGVASCDRRRHRCQLDARRNGGSRATLDPAHQMAVDGVQHIARRNVAQRRKCAVGGVRLWEVVADEEPAPELGTLEADMGGGRDLPWGEPVAIGLPARRLAEQENVVLGVDLEDLHAQVSAQLAAETEDEIEAVVDVRQRMDGVVVEHETVLRLRYAGRDDQSYRKPAQWMHTGRMPDGLGCLREDVV